MQNSPQNLRLLLALASASTLSRFEPAFRGYLVRHCHSLESLRNSLGRSSQPVVLVELATCTRRHIDAFLSLQPARISLIFYVQDIDFSVYQKFPRQDSVLLVRAAEATQAPLLASKFLQGRPVYLRSSPRQLMNSPVLVKRTDWVQASPQGPQRKGYFLDFARHGARLYLPQRLFKPKDYISVVYQSQNQEWITLECQLRWENPTADGGQMLGVQFLAIA